MPLTDLHPPIPKYRGRVVALEHDSALLAGNSLGDPARRTYYVYLPAGYDDESGRRYPVLWSLAAYTNAGPGQVAWRNHGENLPQRLDRLIDSGNMAPAIAVFPDCFTLLGGNQYVNSTAVGPYADYLIEELIPLVDERFRTIAEPGGRAVFGKSSGGYGTLHLLMRYPGHWAAGASHAGDCGFDRICPRDFPNCCDVLARHDGDVADFIRAFWRAKKPVGREFNALMTLCLAASYSPNPESEPGFDLPFDPRTCRLDEAVWARWLEFDPVIDAARCDSLKTLHGLWIDAGNRDQYFIHYGTRELHDVLSARGVDHYYEEFDGSHSGIDWRLDHSLPWLVERLKGGAGDGR